MSGRKTPIPVDAQRTAISRFCNGGTVEYRGKKRRVIVELNTNAGTATVRLEGCRLRKVYNLVDLVTFKPHAPQLSIALDLPDFDIPKNARRRTAPVAPVVDNSAPRDVQENLPLL